MAEKNIEEYLNDLTVQFNRRRQETISEELLDVVTGFGALTDRMKKECDYPEHKTFI